MRLDQGHQNAHHSAMKLLVLAAGIGSRFGGAKQIIEVGPNGETLLEYSIYDARKAGFDEIIFLIRPDIEADFRSNILSRLPSDLRYSLAYQTLDFLLDKALAEINGEKQLDPRELGQREGGLAESKRVKPWGTAHALLCAGELFKQGEAFAVINADDYYGRRAFEAVGSNLSSNPGELCFAGYRLEDVVPASGTVSRAICTLSGDGYLEKIIEHKKVWREGKSFFSEQGESIVELSPDAVVSMNFWGLDYSIFEYAWQGWKEFLSRYIESPTQEFLLPDLIQSIVEKKRARVRMLPASERSFGLTNPEDLQEVRRRIFGFVAEGVYPSPLFGSWKIKSFPRLWHFADNEYGECAEFEDLFMQAAMPWDVLKLLDSYLRSRLDAVSGEKIRSSIPKGVHIEGDVFIDEGCIIEEGAFIRGPAWIGKGCEIRSHCYIRGGLLAGSGVVLGHASEFKHCILLERAQAPHFNYVGDSVLGHHAHIGAGVILSNFRLDGKPIRAKCLDSREKFETELTKFGALIGDNCEIGCNSVLNPGTILGERSVVMPMSLVSGTWPLESRIDI